MTAQIAASFQPGNDVVDDESLLEFLNGAACTLVSSGSEVKEDPLPELYCLGFPGGSKLCPRAVLTDWDAEPKVLNRRDLLDVFAVEGAALSLCHVTAIVKDVMGKYFGRPGAGGL